jgi:K+-transporting ATPase ATPase C chain
LTLPSTEQDGQWRDGWLVAIRLTLLLVLVCGVGYPALLYGGARLLFPGQAEGSPLLDRCGHVVGSRLVGQAFHRPTYFHGRPSAVGYDAASSGGSNLGPTNPALADSLIARAAAFRTTNLLAPGEPIPTDAITASGSGLDPDISPETAGLQIARVAQTRALRVEALRTLVATHTTPSQAGFLGEPHVNVLALNVALDSMDGGRCSSAPSPRS